MKAKKPKAETDPRYELKEINKYQLDDEWVFQDKVVGYYGELLAKARKRFDQAKVAAQIYEAETARRIRMSPKKFGVARLTEAAVKEAVSITLLTSEIQDRLIEAKYKVELLEVVMRRLEHRKKAISDLIYLHGQQYFSKPRVPKNGAVRDRIDQRREIKYRALPEQD